MTHNNIYKMLFRMNTKNRPRIKDTPFKTFVNLYYNSRLDRLSHN